MIATRPTSETAGFRAKGAGPICLIGIAQDPVLGAVARQLRRRGEPFFIFDQNRFPRDHHLQYGRPSGGALAGRLSTPEGSYDIQDIRSAYVRLLGARPAPPDADAEGLAQERLEEERFLSLDHLTRLWSAPTIGLLRPCATNFSKPYQIGLIASKVVEVPATLLTTRPRSVLDWEKELGEVSFKSVSSERSICMLLDRKWKRRLGRIRRLPAQFQEYVRGLDIRVHVAGDAVHALSIETGASDYRYSERYFGQQARTRQFPLPAEIRAELIRMTRRLGLVLAGVDLRRTQDGRYFCFEVNPTPGFSYFDRPPRYAIANSVCDLLTGVVHV